MVKIRIKMKGIMVLVLVCIICTYLVSAANIGLSPATFDYREVLRGGYSEKTAIISTDSDKPITVEATPRGAIKDWLDFSQNFTVSKGKPYSLRVAVTPPADMPNGEYDGFLRLMTSAFGEGVEGHAVGVIRSSLDLAITVEVTDVEIVDCSAYGFKVQSAEEGDDIVFSFDISNSGNIRLKPRIIIDIWDQDQISIVKTEEFSNKEILPTLKDEFVVRVKSNDLEIGQYWADVSVIDCYSSQTLTFDVLEEGALKADGVLTSILTRKTAEVDETVPIKVGFKNTGEKEVEAYFKGQITFGEKIIQILETDRFTVLVSESEEFNLFFTPKQVGKYVISGRVFYSSKRTFESSTVLNVVTKKFQLSYLVTPLIYIVLIVLILFLFYKIRKEKKLYINKLKHLKT